jgi:TRAP-type mannitol/chloroaromatic compound transport system permease large subunit
MLGNFSPEPVGVGDLFAGALIPGLALVGLYILYQIAVAILRPGASPAIPRDEATMGNGNMAGRVMHALVAPLVLIISVLGSILVGIATPTEAAGVGAIGAVLLAGHRLAEGRPLPVYVAAFSLVAVIVLTAFVDMRVTRTRITDFEQASIWVAVALCLGIAWGLCVALIRVYRNATLVAVTRTTARLSSMIFVIILAAQLFSLVFRGLGGDDMVHEFLSGIPGGAVGAMLVVMALMFVMGFFLDTIEILFIVVPIVGPVLLKFGFDPIWLGIMIAVNLQTSFLTPPLGYALFYLRSVAPPEVTTMHIYRGVVPFVCLQLLMLVLLSFFPAMATWLPHVIFR